MPLQPSSLDGLPHYNPGDLTLACAIDYYDGPLNGLIRRGADLFWFDWHNLDAPADDGADDPARVFTLHALPAEAVPAAEAWMQRYQDIHDEYRLIATPHVWPISARQRATLRPLSHVEAEADTHSQLRPRWEDLPATAWFSEAGSSTFAALQTFTLDHQQATDFERWQLDVAQALANEDQSALDRLFRDPPLPGDPLDIFFVRRPGADAACIVRDWRGQPLADDFVMTAKHRVQCFDALLPTPPVP